MFNDLYLIVDKLNELEKKSYKFGSQLTKIITHKNLDARILIFYNFAQLIRSTKLHFILNSEYLISRDWFIDVYLKKWDQNWPYAFNSGISVIVNDHTVIIDEYDQVITVGYIQLLSSIIESRFRIFTIYLDPTAFKNGTDSFKNIYQWFLKKLNKQQYLAILEFSQLLRNTIHNNGVYRNTKEPSKQVSYRDKIFTFQHGKPVLVENLFNLLFFELTPDLLDILNDIINTPEIIKIDYIKDPIY